MKRNAENEVDLKATKRRRLSSDNDASLSAPRKPEAAASAKSAQKFSSKSDRKLNGPTKHKEDKQLESNGKRKGKEKAAEDALPAGPQRSRQEAEEDAYISMLEKRLVIDRSRKGKNRYNAAFEDDGLLGGLLGWFDPFVCVKHTH